MRVAQRGGRNPAYREADGQRVMQQSEITVRVVLNRGAQQATRVDLRSVARLRDHQRGISNLTAESLSVQVGIRSLIKRRRRARSIAESEAPASTITALRWPN